MLNFYTKYVFKSTAFVLRIELFQFYDSSKEIVNSVVETINLTLG